MDSKKGRIGFTAGNFDLLHPGYIYTFETAKQNCDYFMVFLQRDPSETRFTKYKPVVPLYERYKTLMSIKFIDEVVCYDDEEDLLRLIEFYKPDHILKTSDVMIVTYKDKVLTSRDISFYNMNTNILAIKKMNRYNHYGVNNELWYIGTNTWK